MSTLSRMPLADVVDAALEEVRNEEDESSPLDHLIELQSRATDEVFDTAVRLSRSADEDERELGIRVLQDLGPEDDAGRRRFSDRAVPHLLDLLHDEHDAWLERCLLQALAGNGAVEALAEFLDRADHPDSGVRVTVAFELPYLTDADEVDERVIDVLEALSHDADADVRSVALYGLVEDGLNIDEERLLRIARSLAADPDDAVREILEEHFGSAL